MCPLPPLADAVHVPLSGALVMALRIKDGRCPRCALNDGWDPDADPDDLRKCDHGALQAAVDAAEARDSGLAATVDANPQAFKAAVAIIRETALTCERFSANDVRARMKLAQIPGEVVGAAFRKCAKDRLIRADSYVTSTDAGTHMHPVRSWMSLIYRAGKVSVK